MSKAQEYKRKAEVCEEQARASANEDAKQMFLGLARDWRWMAEEVERRQREINVTHASRPRSLADQK
jgi:hypothetical protein